PLDISGIEMALALPDLGGPFSAEGALTYADTPLTIRASVAAPRALLQGGTSPVSLNIDGDLGSVGFAGAAAGPANPSVDGTVDIDIPSLAALAGLLPGLVPADLPVDRVALAGGLAATPSRIALAGATLTVDDITAAGDV